MLEFTSQVTRFTVVQLWQRRKHPFHIITQIMNRIRVQRTGDEQCHWSEFQPSRNSCKHLQSNYLQCISPNCQKCPATRHKKVNFLYFHICIKEVTNMDVWIGVCWVAHFLAWFPHTEEFWQHLISEHWLACYNCVAFLFLYIVVWFILQSCYNIYTSTSC